MAYAVSPEVVGLISDPERSTMRHILRDALLEDRLICATQAALGLD